MATFDLFDFSDGVEPFSAFLETTTYYEQLSRDEAPISLIEAIELWMWLGDGLAYCSTFVSYQTVVMRIVNNWLDHDRTAVGFGHAVTIWPHDETIPLRLLPERNAELHLGPEVFDQLRSTRPLYNLPATFSPDN